jgi:elongator complex protein 4
VTSWGSSGIDSALGGGVPLGSLVLLVEDAPTKHHEAFVRIFLAQGLAHGHALALAQQHTPPSSTFSSLPTARTRSGIVTEPSAVSRPNLSIAWRYSQTSARTDRASEVDVQASLYRHAFDFSEPSSLSPDAPVSFLGFGTSSCLDDLLTDIRAHLRSAETRRLFPRIVVSGLTPAYWSEAKMRMNAFVHCLRVLVQRVNAVAVVSLPRCAYVDEIRREADIVLSLDTFDGRGAGVAGLGKEWLGVLVVEKPFRPHGAVKPMRGQADAWVFKRGRRKYVLEHAAAAPELDEGGSNEQSIKQPSVAKTSFAEQGGCGSNGSSENPFDF